MDALHQTERPGTRDAISTVTADELLELATARHRAGDVLDARRLYQQVLAAAPSHALGLFRSGLLELQDTRPAAALPLIAQAAATQPNEPRFQMGLGQALQALGRWEEAVRAYARAAHLDAQDPDAQFALALALQSLGRYADAGPAYERAVELRPDFFAAFNNLGICRQRGGQFEAAAAAYTRALELRPTEVRAMANLGTVLQAVGRISDAVEMLRRAREREPQVVAHAVNLGMALCCAREFEAAQLVLREALAMDHLREDPAAADAAFNLGIALHALGQSNAAVDCYRQAIAARPGYADAFVNLGNVYKQIGDFAAAGAAYADALAADPGSVVAMNNAGCLLRTLGQLDDAEDMLRRGLESDPLNPALYDNLGSVLKDAGELDAAVDCFRRSLDLDPDNAATHSNLAYALSFQSLEPEPVLEECLRFNQRFAAFAPTARPAVRPREGRLRVAYVSPDFREHCQSLFMIPLLANHDHAKFEIVCYSSVERSDEITRRIAGFADLWRDVHTLDDAALAALIRDDGIDILVDLSMHMAGARPLLFARKPAPLQVAWLAYPGTTGLRAMDYRFSDARLDPPGFDHHYSERTVRLPDSFWCYDPLATDPCVNALPALERGHVTFGCLNNPCKLTPSTLDLWARVLCALPDARLLLMAPPGRHRARLIERLAAGGVRAERVRFVPHQRRADYLRAYHDIDLGLDTFPYNGHTTSLDAAWMGVPTVSRVGATCVGRAGLSQLVQLNLAGLAAATDAEFITAAVELAADLDALADLRQQLRSRLTQSALMDAPRFTRGIEAAYQAIWLAGGMSPDDEGVAGATGLQR